MKQMWGVGTLCLVIIICPLLAILSKNAIASIQVRYDFVSFLSYHYKLNEISYSFVHSTLLVIIKLQIFALSVEKKSNDMKKQKRKQEKLVLKMLPKAIVERVMSGETAAETFDQATLYFSSVDGFVNVSTKCKYVIFIKNINL